MRGVQRKYSCLLTYMSGEGHQRKFHHSKPLVASNVP